MGIATITKDEVRDILVAVRLAAGATAASAGCPDESQPFLSGYNSALEVVAAALGLELPAAGARLQSSAGWLPAPRRVPTPHIRDWPIPSMD